jgi:hypothetical protein
MYMLLFLKRKDIEIDEEYPDEIKLNLRRVSFSALQDCAVEVEFDGMLQSTIAIALLRWCCRSNDYKINAILKISHDDETVQDWKLLNVWVKSISFPAGSMTSPGPVRMTVIFAAQHLLQRKEVRNEKTNRTESRER